MLRTGEEVKLSARFGLLSELVLVQPVKSLLDGLLDLLLPPSFMDCGEQ